MNERNHRPVMQGPIMRQRNWFDDWVDGVAMFTGKLVKQLAVTLCATMLGAGRDYLLQASSDEVTGRIMGNMGGQPSKDANKLYGRNQYPDSRYDPYYNNYSKQSGAESFPGF